MSADRYVALLRGINVGGHHKLPMADLRAIFEAHGAADVHTYIQSGNVVFTATSGLARALPDRVGAAIAERFGFEAPIVLRTGSELERVVEACPFTVEPDDEKLLHVVFLADRPSPERAAALDPERSPKDRFVVHDREVYVHYAGGVARSKLSASYLDATLGTRGTARNWRTTLKLLELAQGS